MDMRQNAFIKIKLKNNSRLKLSERHTDRQTKNYKRLTTSLIVLNSLW